MKQTPPTHLHGTAGSPPVASRQPPEGALARLKKLATSLVWVMRDGRLQHLAGTERVPGDMVRVEAGDRSFARQAQVPFTRWSDGS